MYTHINFILFMFILFLYKTRPVAGISGGRAVVRSTQYPFAVRLTYPVLCGGSIISLNPPWVLTTAHCLQGMDDSPQTKPTVAYGSAYSEEQKYATIKRVIIHPMYLSNKKVESPISDNLDTVPYDIALIELKETLIQEINTNRIPLYDRYKQIKTTTSSLFETVGMGYTGYQKSEPSILQLAICNKTTDILQENNFNHSVTLMTSNSALCHGDSGKKVKKGWGLKVLTFHFPGSALIYRRETDDTNYYMAGVLSRIINAYDPDPNNASCPLHDSELTHFVNAFVKPSAHIDWIMNVTKLSISALTAPMEWSANTSIMTMKSSSQRFGLNCIYILITLLALIFICH